MEHLGTFQQSLQAKDVFSVTWELVPGRGAREKAQDVVFASAEKAAKGGRIHALTITDNPGGHPALAAEMLGVEINKLGIEPLVHFTCKDKKPQPDGRTPPWHGAGLHPQPAGDDRRLHLFGPSGPGQTGLRLRSHPPAHPDHRYEPGSGSAHHEGHRPSGPLSLLCGRCRQSLQGYGSRAGDPVLQAQEEAGRRGPVHRVPAGLRCPQVPRAAPDGEAHGLWPHPPSWATSSFCPWGPPSS